VRAGALAAVGIAATLALVAAGCGGGNESSSTTSTSETTPVVEWADGLCTAITTWKQSLTDATSSITLSPSKEKLQQAADDVKSANQKLSEDLKALGTPDTESGQQVKQSVDDLSSTLDTQESDIEDAANNPSNLSGLASAVTTISTSLAAMGTAVSSTIHAIDNADVKGDMQAAFNQASSCSDITGSSS
jgi:hypothetical protein